MDIFIDKKETLLAYAIIYIIIIATFASTELLFYFINICMYIYLFDALYKMKDVKCIEKKKKCFYKII